MANRNPTNDQLRAAVLLALQEIADEERTEELRDDRKEPDVAAGSF